VPSAVVSLSSITSPVSRAWQMTHYAFGKPINGIDLDYLENRSRIEHGPSF